MKGSLTNDRGIALLLVLLLMVLILSTTGVSLFFSGINLKTASNIKTGSSAIHAADAAVQHGLALMPPGVTFSYGSATTIVNNYSFGNA
jgi:Tfp pilus assembly protein PilX